MAWCGVSVTGMTRVVKVGSGGAKTEVPGEERLWLGLAQGSPYLLRRQSERLVTEIFEPLWLLIT